MWVASLRHRVCTSLTAADLPPTRVATCSSPTGLGLISFIKRQRKVTTSACVLLRFWEWAGGCVVDAWLTYDRRFVLFKSRLCSLCFYTHLWRVQTYGLRSVSFIMNAQRRIHKCILWFMSEWLSSHKCIPNTSYKYRYPQMDIGICNCKIHVKYILNCKNVFYSYKYRYPFVCALKCICEKSNLCINHKIHLWIILCAFMMNETDLTLYRYV